MFNNILLVDSQVHGYQTFIDSVNATTFPIVFTNSSTKSSILSLIQQRFTKIHRIGIVFEGQPHYMFLDNQPLFIPNEISPFSENVQFIIEIIRSFNVQNIDYLGCHTLNFPHWTSYYDIIQTNTNSIVGASNDMTGNIQYGGDWVMESTGTDIELIYFTNSIGYYKYLLGHDSTHTIVLASNGDIYGCGDNSSSQLGNNRTTNTPTLTQMTNTTGKTPTLISSGGSHTIVLMSDGTIYGCGNNSSGQLGKDIGNTSNSPTLTQMKNTTGRTPISISCGAIYTMVLMSDGTIFGCGYNGFGQLGNGNGSNSTTLTQMTSLPTTNGIKAVSVISGVVFTMVLMSDGTIYGCGYNRYGQLGDGTTNDSNTLKRMTSLPTTNSIGNSIKPVSISCGAYHTMVLMSDGTIYGCGLNGQSQLGNGTTNGVNDSNPTLRKMTNVPSTNDIKPISISCGGYHTMVLMSDGKIYGCGGNWTGQLGTGTTTTSSNTLIQMTTLPTANDIKPKSISSGAYYTKVLMSDGTTYACGYNGLGNLGIGITNYDEPYPTLRQMLGVDGVGFITNIVGLSDGTIPTVPLITIVPIICFKEGTLIQTINGYVPIQELRKSDLVKTLKHDYKPIDMIGKRDIYNHALNERIKDQLYKCSQREYPEVFEDLVITGAHCILVDDFVSEEQKEKVIEINGDTYVTDNKYRLPVCADNRASIYETPGTYTIYHLALENDDYYTNYGIYANGLLVETCSKKILKEMSNLVLIE